MKNEITYDTIITLQRLAQWFDELKVGVTELHYGEGYRNITIRDVNRRLPEFIKCLNTARANVIDCWERE